MGFLVESARPTLTSTVFGRGLADEVVPVVLSDGFRVTRARDTPLPGPAHTVEEALVATDTEKRNMELMQTLDDAWNAQDLDVFRSRHKPDVIVRWPGKIEPTIGIEDHTQESIDFFRTFPDQHLDNRPYKTFFASGDWTCSIARFRGTMAGPMKTADGKEIPPTGKSFDLDFYTVALWNDGQIVEENLMYDLVTFLKQIGLG